MATLLFIRRMDKHLSIIIPVYNVEKYVERCIFSIVDQPVSPESYEVIIVNDGSTDKSGDILKELSNDYPSIRLIKQENKGLGAARNTGLDNAIGEYIFFIDADDYIANDSLLPILNSIKQTKADIILFGISEVYLNGKKKTISFHLPEKDELLFVEDYINDYTILSSAWQGIFKRSLLEEHAIRMPEGKLAEDDDFVVKLFSVADTLYYLPISVYNYFQRPQSISNHKDEAHNQKLIFDKLEIFQSLIQYTERYSRKRRSGLQRKLDSLSLEIVRLLIRKKISSHIIDHVLNKLAQLEYYPLIDKHYNLKYNIFCMLLNKPSKVRFFASSNFLSSFF